jgi:hypothetical protein
MRSKYFDPEPVKYLLTGFPQQQTLLMASWLAINDQLSFQLKKNNRAIFVKIVKKLAEGRFLVFLFALGNCLDIGLS